MGRCGEQKGLARVSGMQGTSGQEPGVSRYIGLSLGGAKSERTCVTVIDYYHQQDKAFVVDIFDSIGPEADLNADDVLLSIIEELFGNESEHKEEREFMASFGQPSVRILAADAPLSFPPCLLECEKSCGGYEECKRPAVKWMRAQYTKQKKVNSRTKHFTPYSQRPVDLYFRYKYPRENLFQDETMGANIAPQAARMSYVRRKLPADLRLIEVWPKLAVFSVQKALRMTQRDVLDYRHLERGVHIRSRFIERLAEKTSLFVYDRDLKKFVTNVCAFDSLVCAWVALLTDLDKVQKFRSDLPLDTGWIQVPDL